MALSDTLAELVVKITADTAGLNEGMDGIKNKLSSFGGVAKKAGIALAGIGIAAIGAGAASVSSFAGMADELDEMSTRTGLSTTKLQELQYAAKLTGSSLDGMDTAIKRMQVGITGGNTALEEMGVDLTSLKGLGTEEQFSMLADMIGEIADPTERAAMAVAMFGKAGTDMIPMLEGGSKGLSDMAKEANDLGIIMDEASVKSGATFKDGLDNLEMALGGVVNQIGAALVPVLTPLIPLFEDLIKTLPLKEFGELMRNLLPPIVELFSKLMKAIPLDIMVKFVSAALIPVLNILEAILPVLEPILDLFGGLLQILTPVLNVLGDVLSFVAQILGSGITSILSGISSLFGGEFKSFNMPSFASSFASGGIVTSPRLAMVGEAGPEAVIPLNQMNSNPSFNLFIDGEQITNVIERRMYDRVRYQQ